MTHPGMGPPPGTAGSEANAAPVSDSHAFAPHRQAACFVDGLVVGAALSVLFSLFCSMLWRIDHPFRWGLAAFVAVAVGLSFGVRALAGWRR